MNLTDDVRAFWEAEPCGTSPAIVGEAPPGSREWYASIEAHRYRQEPFIHAVAQFTRHRDMDLLEVGVGAGTDHLQWARAGARCSGVDLTDAAIDTTRAHLARHGLGSNLQRIEGVALPFPDASFDTVYSWGVIHHTSDPAAMIAEIHRVLRPGGGFIGMLYHRRSLVAWRLWVRHALLGLRPWRSVQDVIWHHMESPGTRCYTSGEVAALFDAFEDIRVQPWLTPYDVERLPAGSDRWLPRSLGWFLSVEAQKALAPRDGATPG